MLTSRTWGLLICAALLLTAGVLNFAQRIRSKFPPTDGVAWIQTGPAIVASEVDAKSAAGRAGVTKGDHLQAISVDEKRFEQVVSASEVQIYLEAVGAGGHLTYAIERPSFPVDSRFYYADIHDISPRQRWKAEQVYLNLVGLVYLLVGFFVLFKQGGRAPFVLHFATLSLVAFVVHFYQPTGRFEDLDAAIAILKDAAFILFAPLFVHFCAIYPTRYQLAPGRRWLASLLYVPAMVLLGMLWLTFTAPTNLTRLGIGESSDIVGWFVKAGFLHFTLALVIGAAMLVRRFLVSNQAVVRQQLKWVVLGSVLAVVPLTAFYALTYTINAQANRLSAGLAIVPLVLIPLTFGNSVMRYRLMDVDIVVRRAVVYAIASLSIAVLIGTVVFFAVLYASDGAEVITRLTSGTLTLQLLVVVASMAAVVMLAAPIKSYLQERADRFFYGERYDMRQGLLDFGRTLSATTGLDQLLNALISRLREVLNVERIAIFVEDDSVPEGYVVARVVGLSGAQVVPADFREMIRVRSAATGVVRADDLEVMAQSSGFVRRELHYYVPCVVRGRMVAVIGLGRTADGALLSSDDVGILRTISGYVAVAIENSLLYQAQREHAAELERLKEFNESIVESINVGLLAVDLDGRIKSCNSAIEKMLGVKRAEVAGKRVVELFSDDFAATIRHVLGRDDWNFSEPREIYKLHTATTNNKPLVLNIALAPLKPDSAGTLGAIIALEDVTSKFRLEEQLQQREKLSSIGLLAAGVAHEVNTPLTGVSSYTQMLLAMLPETDPKHALLQKVKTQTERASNIVNNLLNFSRTGGATEFADLDLHRVLDDTIQLLEPQLRNSGIEIKQSYGLEVPSVFANAGKLQQVFTNLILNARDAIIDGGTIEIVTKATRSELVEIEVRDTGTGIPAENIAKIYDPFFTTKGVGRGTGLGLAVTYGIVQEHAGDISVRSYPGAGTTFLITIPTARSQQRLRAAAGD